MPTTASTESQVITGVHADLPIPRQATTSRALLHNDVVRVVVFAFDTGEQLSEHTAAKPVVVQLLEGRMRFHLDGVDHQLAAGDVVYLAPGAPHALEALEPSRLSLVLINQER
jgi:quercetin dioxygenase-like cupin family protein